MSVKGGSYSPKRVQQERDEAKRDEMAFETKLAAHTLIRQLLDATIANMQPVEPDVRKRAVGVYLAAHICAPPRDRMVFAHRCCPASSTIETTCGRSPKTNFARASTSSTKRSASRSGSF